MHPLPRTDELAYELDSDPRAVYFEQAAAGVPVRMALIAWLLENAGGARGQARRSRRSSFKGENAPRCPNPNCITPPRRPLPASALPAGARRSAASMLMLRCDFCERELRVEFVGHAQLASLLSLRRKPLRLRPAMDRGRLAGGFRDRQAGRGSRLRALSARAAARNHERRRDRARACEAIAAQIIARPARPGTASAFVGVVSRGAMLALRLRDLIEGQTGCAHPARRSTFMPRATADSQPIDGPELRGRRTAPSCWSTT